jgi:hypothetical protein
MMHIYFMYIQECQQTAERWESLREQEQEQLEVGGKECWRWKRGTAEGESRKRSRVRNVNDRRRGR